MKSPIPFYYTCKQCEHDFRIEVWPVIPARTYGPPEDCHPEEGGWVEPDECPKCEHPVDQADAHEQAADWADGRRDDL